MRTTWRSWTPGSPAPSARRSGTAASRAAFEWLTLSDRGPPQSGCRTLADNRAMGVTNSPLWAASEPPPSLVRCERDGRPGTHLRARVADPVGGGEDPRTDG